MTDSHIKFLCAHLLRYPAEAVTTDLSVVELTTFARIYFKKQTTAGIPSDTSSCKMHTQVNNLPRDITLPFKVCEAQI